ncbi:MAG: hemerythrin domain-containing protein [Candidatus Riflebacteria bacterium]|nr:hemerythrin domain-containing protein [Candidatus Riflebacteria bacterium]
MTNIDNNFVLSLSKEHKLILETLGEIDAILKFTPQTEVAGKLKAVIEPFKAKLVEHQELEEKVIFKAALESMPTETIISIVLRLQKEHGKFLADVEAIYFNLLHLSENTSLQRTIETNLSQLSTLIKKHASVEVKELFPLITNNSRCRQLIDQYSKKHTS